MDETIFFSCENGNDICINSFATLEEALHYANRDDEVKEIWKYNEEGMVNICWKK